MSSATIDHHKLRHSLNAELSTLANFRIPTSSIQALDGAAPIYGGFGEVQQASYAPDNSVQHITVAVKKLKPCGELEQRPRVVVALVREVRVWRELNHPNILKLLGFDLDEHDFQHAQLATPWKAHGHVLSYIRRTKPPYTRRLELAIDTAKGLAYLHGLPQRVCHGDVKPENVLIDDSGLAQLCDFGLARLLEGVPSGLTTTSQPSMTVHYASPELAINGVPHTCESDVWAWGCTAMVIMTDVVPYQSETGSSAVFLAMNKGILPADLSRLPGLSFVARNLIAESWNLVPKARPNMRQCTQRLAAYSSTTSKPAVTAKDLSTPAEGNPLTMATLPMNVIRVPAELKTGGENWFAIFNPHAPRKLDVSLVRTLDHPNVVSCVRFSPDGQFVATACDRTARVYNVGSGQTIRTLTHDAVSGLGEGHVRSISFGLRGRFLATGSEDNLIRIWDVNSSSIAHVLAGHSDAIYSLAFAWGTMISGSGDGTVGFRNLESGSCYTLNVPTSTTDTGVASLAISADCKSLAAGSVDGDIRIWDTANWRLVQHLKGHSDSIYSVAFTPDGKRLVSGSFDKMVRYWDVDPSSRQPDGVTNSTTGDLLSECEGHILSVCVSPDGAWAAWGATDHGVHVCDLTTGLVQLTLKGHSNTVTDVDFSAAGSASGGLLASAGGDCAVNIWKYEPRVVKGPVLLPISHSTTSSSMAL